MTNNNDLPGNVPLPPGGLTLPDVLTESDLFMNLDPSVLYSQPANSQSDKRPTSSLGLSSQLLPDSHPAAQGSKAVERPQLEDDTGLVLDLGEDADMSIEVGRNAPAPRPVGEDLYGDGSRLFDDDLDLDLGEDAPPLNKAGGEGIFGSHQDDYPAGDHQPEDLTMAGMDEDLGVPAHDDGAGGPLGEWRRDERDPQSPLSSARSSVVRDMDDSFMNEDAVAAQRPQRVKRRKLIQPDVDTVLPNSQIKEQQNNRSRILKPASLLPRDPFLLTLMAMQKNGDFVSTVMGGGSRSWAPELREMLSIDSARKAGQLKRKRDSGVADMDIDAAGKLPGLDLEGEEGVLHSDEGIGLGLAADSGLNQQSSEIDIPGDHGAHARIPGEDEFSDEGGIVHGGDNYDDPTVHPADSGPVSLGTKHAVHILRDQFDGTADSSQQKKSNVFFQDLLPEGKTSKSDATKMFFEVLVLASKDAVKVEQNSSSTIGNRLKIRGKQGLWGSWAETTETSGETGAEEVAAAA